MSPQKIMTQNRTTLQNVMAMTWESDIKVHYKF